LSKESYFVKQVKVLFGAILAIALVVGLYFLNRYWIAPATKHSSVQTAGAHPPAPEFSLTDLNGRQIDLADRKGKVVLLDFWATWCGPCRIEIPGFVELQERYRDQGLSVIGISFDDGPEPVREFYREFKMNYPVAMGTDRVAELYGGILGLPTTFLIGRDGRIYAKHVGATDLSVFEDEIKELLAAGSTAEVAGFKKAEAGTGADKIELGNPAEIDSEVPGVDLTGLTPAQVEQFKKQLDAMQCPCGCNLSILKCRIQDRSCGVSLRIARNQLKRFPKPAA
jgi:thiol-disulfide isomerase/thioredoxin